jgi:branched-chain amino acid transport system ATP-binding protein
MIGHGGAEIALDHGSVRDRPLLEVVDLQAGYGISRVLFGVSLRVECGEVVGLLGRNGAGKSTTLKAIMGIVAPTAGRVFLSGNELSHLPPHTIARAGIGYVPQDRRIFPNLTVRENLEVGCRAATHSDEQAWNLERVQELFPALRGLLDRWGRSLSGGEQQMLAIARTLVGNPRVLLLDEPSEGLAPMVVRSLAEQVLRLKRAGVTVVLSEQNVRFTARVTDRAYVLEKGHIRKEGDTRTITEDSGILGKYLHV